MALGPETGEQMTLSSPDQERRRRITEAVRQTRSAAGADSLLRVLDALQTDELCPCNWNKGDEVLKAA